MIAYFIFSTLLCTVCVDCSGPLPQYMLGKFQLETSEGFSGFMYKMGVGWFNRAVSRLIKNKQRLLQINFLSYKSVFTIHQLGLSCQNATIALHEIQGVKQSVLKSIYCIFMLKSMFGAGSGVFYPRILGHFDLCFLKYSITIG